MRWSHGWDGQSIRIRRSATINTFPEIPMRVLFATPMAVLMATAGLILGASGPAAAMNISLDGGCTASGASVDGAGNVSITVSCPTTTPPTTGVPTGCKLYTTKSTATVGESYNIYGKCTGGDAPITFTLSGTDMQSTPTLTQNAQGANSELYATSGSAAKTYTYTATASNAASIAAGTTVNATGVSVAVSSVTQPPSGTIAAACSAAGYANPRVIQMDWNNQSRLYTKDVGGFGANDVLVVALTVPASATPTPAAGAKSVLYGSEWIDLPVSRTGYLSRSPCDFSMSFGKNTWTESIGPRQYFTIGTTRVYSNTPAVAPGATVYWNIKNTYPEQCLGSCNFFTAFTPGTM
jgi:hypothetical protein